MGISFGLLFCKTKFLLFLWLLNWKRCLSVDPFGSKIRNACLSSSAAHLWSVYSLHKLMYRLAIFTKNTIFYPKSSKRSWIFDFRYSFLDFIAFFWVFSYIIDDLSCLNCFISTKLSQIVCLINVYILLCQYSKCYGRLSNLMCFFGNFHILLHVWNVITPSNFYKLCVKAEV